MNLQEKLIDTLATARARARSAARRVDVKASLATMAVAGRELNKVARRHAARFIKENSAIAVTAGKEVSELARSTFATLAKPTAARKTVRKAPASRKRAARKAT